MKRLTGDVGQIQEGRPISSPWPRRFARVRHIFLRGKLFTLLRALPTNQPPPPPPLSPFVPKIVSSSYSPPYLPPILSFHFLLSTMNENKWKEEGEGEDESERNEKSRRENRESEQGWTRRNTKCRTITFDLSSTTDRRFGFDTVEWPSSNSNRSPLPFLPTFVRVIVFTYGLRN